MKLSEFDFELPADLIATRPVRPRSSARLLVVTPDTMHDARAYDLATFLRPGDRLVVNDTRVLAARLSGSRLRRSADLQSRARIEVTLLEPTAQGHWRALIKPLRKVREGEVIRFSDDFSARLVA
ncbi:MAG: S-adenosylmethionine:tRNA ribosyltransferase-isomerase, partial [Paracoccaceae bacterium]